MQMLYDMNKTQTRSLALIFVLAIGVTSIVWLAYDRHHRINEEGLVYIEIFQPDPKVIEFDNVVVLSKPSICKSGDVHYKGLPSDATKEFIKLNEKSMSPVRLSKLEGLVPIVSWEDTKKLYENGTVNFFRPEKHKLIYLSRVGFNSVFTEAIACIEVSENSFGRGILYYLNKENNQWRLIEARNIWVS